MAIEGITNITSVSTDAFNQFVIEIGKIGLWLQAIGVLILLWLIFQAISIASNTIKRKKLTAIESRLSVIEKKLNQALRKKL